MKGVHLYFRNFSWAKSSAKGFNISKHMVVENLREVSTRGQRFICDYFQS